MKYILVMEGTYACFTNEINRMLREGWELHGGTYKSESFYHQAMIYKQDIAGMPFFDVYDIAEKNKEKCRIARHFWVNKCLYYEPEQNLTVFIDGCSYGCFAPGNILFTEENLQAIDWYIS